MLNQRIPQFFYVDPFKTLHQPCNEHEHNNEVLNFFNNRSTNALLNRSTLKLNSFRAQPKGVVI